MKWPHVVTVYNYTKAGYHRTVLRGVLWEDTRGKNVNKTGSDVVDSVRVQIPFTVDAAGAAYKVSTAFQAAPDGAWTLQTKAKDFVVNGECPFLPTPGASISGLTASYAAYTITSVATVDYGSPWIHHWEVGAK